MTDTIAILGMALLVVLALAAAAVAYSAARRRRTLALEQQFGPEYGNAVEQYGSVGRAERELSRRREQVQKLQIRRLTPAEQERYRTTWSATQKQFVDDPLGAIRTANALVKEILERRGYPLGDFDDRVRALSVDHARVVQHYRAARTLLAENENTATPETESLRQSMIHYRALFQDLIETPDSVVVDRDAPPNRV